MKIKMLNAETIGKIAAGEVILRPVSVVKELTENALDAGATAVEVAVEKGGKQKITVTDNGCGIAYNEVPAAFKRHATSKISFAEDLDALESLGFRGEALASVISAADVTITTRAQDEEIGSQSFFRDGAMVSRRVSPYEKGTEIVVEELFSTMPARLKYLKKDEDEEGVIRDVMRKLALSHPETAFTYKTDGTMRFRTSGSGDVQEAAAAVFGRAFAGHLRPFAEENAPMKVSGLIGDLDARRSGRERQILFINGRYVQDKLLAQAYEEAWAGMLMKHQHPSGILFVELPPRMLDVNIHPQKTELRILNESLVSLLFRQCVRTALRKMNLTPELCPAEDTEQQSAAPAPRFSGERQPAELSPHAVPAPGLSPAKSETNATIPVTDKPEIQTEMPGAVPFDPETLLQDEPDAPWRSKYFGEPAARQADPAGEHLKSADQASLSHPQAASDVDKNSRGHHSECAPLREEAPCTSYPSANLHIESEEHKPYQAEQTSGVSLVREEAVYLDRPDFTRIKYIGQLFNTYLILEDRPVVYLIDQHAAHEALLFNKFEHAFTSDSGFSSQSLLIPTRVEADPEWVERLPIFSDQLTRFGFSAEPDGEDALKVHAVPVILGENQPAELVVPVLMYFAGQGRAPERELERIVSMSCKAAVKGNQTLDASEVKTLLSRLMEIPNPYTCPHGRPVIYQLKEYELEKLFKRVL